MTSPDEATAAKMSSCWTKTSDSISKLCERRTRASRLETTSLSTRWSADLVEDSVQSRPDRLLKRKMPLPDRPESG